MRLLPPMTVVGIAPCAALHHQGSIGGTADHRALPRPVAPSALRRPRPCAPFVPDGHVPLASWSRTTPMPSRWKWLERAKGTDFWSGPLPRMAASPVRWLKMCTRTMGDAARAYTPGTRELVARHSMAPDRGPHPQRPRSGRCRSSPVAPRGALRPVSSGDHRR